MLPRRFRFTNSRPLVSGGGVDRR